MVPKFPNQSYISKIYKHVSLPVYVTEEFDFYRCIEFNDKFYGKTISELHHGNLRDNMLNKRYSALFPNERISYWADSVKTARAEVKYHNSGNSLITFHAYDDATSSFPTRKDVEPLIIIDGRDIGFSVILDKIEKGISLSNNEIEIVHHINELKPDCLVYESLRRVGGVNYLFFEKGFKKLSLKEVRLHINKEKKSNSNRIICAFGCDYSPVPKRYGYYFEKIAKVRFDNDYIKSNEFISRNNIYKQNVEAFSKPFMKKIETLMEKTNE